jgi:hypothetical protein
MHRFVLVFVLVLMLAACKTGPADTGDRSYGMSGSAANPLKPSARVPPIDAQRKVNEQDCSQPVVLEQGNLRCK